MGTPLLSRLTLLPSRLTLLPSRLTPLLLLSRLILPWHALNHQPPPQTVPRQPLAVQLRPLPVLPLPQTVPLRPLAVPLLAQLLPLILLPWHLVIPPLKPPAVQLRPLPVLPLPQTVPLQPLAVPLLAQLWPLMLLPWHLVIPPLKPLPVQLRPLPVQLQPLPVLPRSQTVPLRPLPVPLLAHLWPLMLLSWQPEVLPLLLVDQLPPRLTLPPTRKLVCKTKPETLRANLRSRLRRAPKMSNSSRSSEPLISTSNRPFK